MLSIPIISEFDGKGIDKAIKQFKQLETVGEKAQFAIKKAAVPAAAALGAVTAALGAAVAAAAEDEQQAAQLALTLNNVTGATEKQVKATEDMISAMSRATGTADSELRPALAVLVTGTKDIATATEALSLAQDIAIGSGKSLSEVSDALAKAYGGNMKGLQALSPEIKAMIKDGATLDEVMNVLGGTFGGAAATAADTAAGRFKILKNSLDETTESIGAALLPIVQKVLPVLQKFADWAQQNPQAFLAIAGAITAISVAILAVNFAMALNPFTAIAAGVAALVVGIIYAYNKFETFRTIVNGVLNGLISGFEIFANAWINTINLIIRGMNLLNPFTDIASLPNIDLGGIGGSSSAAAVGSGFAREGGVGAVMAGVPSMPAMPSPAAPMAGGGGGSSSRSQGPSFAATNRGGDNSYAFTAADFQAAGLGSPVTINVAGGISSSADIGRSVVDALTQYTQVYGPLNLAIR
jgi:hypothetical protein